MKVWYKGHHYQSQIFHTLREFTELWNIKGFVSALFHGEKYLVWFMHLDDCCDYWTPIDDPRAQRALIMDDELGLSVNKKGDM